MVLVHPQTPNAPNGIPRRIRTPHKKGPSREGPFVSNTSKFYLQDLAIASAKRGTVLELSPAMFMRLSDTM